MQKTNVKRSIVTVEDRRGVFLAAKMRKPQDVVEIGHEVFIRRALKDVMGWPRTESAPAMVKDAAKMLAAQLVQRDKDLAAAKAKAAAEHQANLDAANQDIADAAV